MFFVTSEVVFALLPPLAPPDETNNLADIAIQITISPPNADLTNSINVMINAIGGTAGMYYYSIYFINFVNT